MPDAKELMTVAPGERPTEESVRWLLEHREETVPAALAVLDEFAALEAIPEPRDDTPLHAIFVLAALEAREAWPALERVLRKDADEFVHPYFGDTITECLSWALAG